MLSPVSTWMGDRLGTQLFFPIFSAFLPPIFRFYPSVNDFCIQLGTFGRLFDMIYHLYTPCIALQKLLNQNQPLYVTAISGIGLLWRAQHLVPIIKIFIRDFFPVNLFHAPRDKILCHAQFAIEAQSLQKGRTFPYLYYYKFYCIEYALQLMPWLHNEFTQQKTAIAH